MISGINMHCADRPTMELVDYNGRCWIELSSGKAGEHVPSSRMALFASDQPREALQRAVDGFNAGFAQVVAIISDEPATVHLIAAE